MIIAYLNIEYYLYIASAALLIFVVLGLIIFRKRPHTAPKLNAPAVIAAFGGAANVKEATAHSSRLTIYFINKTNIDEIKLKDLGIISVIYMSNKAILLIGDEALKLADAINHLKSTR